MNQNETIPTLDELLAHIRREFSFLAPLGFVETPLCGRPSADPFQVRFSNGNLVVVIAGSNYGLHADIHLEDLAGEKVPVILFVPHDLRPQSSKRKRSRSTQLADITADAARVQEYCAQVLRGDMAAFHDRAAEWRRITGRSPGNQPRRLP